MHLLPSKTVHQFLFTYLFFLFKNPVRSQTWYICAPQVNYTAGSAYEANLNLLLQYLNTTTVYYGYYNTTFGVDPDQIYGLAQCRGDASSDSCRNCLNTSMVEIKRFCRNNREAFIRYDNCLLRYSFRRFFSIAALTPGHTIPNYISAPNPALFDKRVGELMNNLSSTQLPASMYVAGTVTSSDYPLIFGTVECVRDISSSNCHSCLISMINSLPNCCHGNTGAQVMSLSCHIRYEVYKFFQDPPPPGTVAAPPLVLAPPPRGAGSRLIIIIIIVVVVAASVLVFVILGFCIYYCLQRRKSRQKEKEEEREELHSVGTLDGSDVVDGNHTPEVLNIDLAKKQAAMDLPLR